MYQTIQKQEDLCKEPDFTWDMYEQVEWPCGCDSSKNKYQSPINLNSKTSKKVDDILKFRFKEQQIVKYGFIGNEPEFYANWGSFTHISKNSIDVYQAFKIVFKVGESEHLITY